MSTTDAYEEKVYFDSRLGEEIRVQRKICGRCKRPIPLGQIEGHPECHRAFLEEEAIQREKIRQNDCMIKFGRVVSRQEEEWMTYPDSRVPGYGETYNQHLKRIEAERRQAYFDRCAARTNRKEKLLPEAEHQLKWLTAQVKIDEREQIEDDANEEKRLKEQTQQ